MRSVARGVGLRFLAVLSLPLIAAACTTDQGGYLFLGINQSDQDVIVWLDEDPSIVELPAHTRAGIGSGWGYREGPTLTVMDTSCSVLGSSPVVGPGTVLTIAADDTLKTDQDRRVFDGASERLVSALTDHSCQPFRASNRMTQDVVFRFGDLAANRVFVPACGQVAFDSARIDEDVPPPATAVEVRYELVPGQAALMPTFTITAEKVWTGILASPPPCQGIAPTPTSAAS